MKTKLAAVVLGLGLVASAGSFAGPIPSMGSGAAQASIVERVYQHHFWYRHSFHNGPCWQRTFWGNYRYVCGFSNRTNTSQY
jgi:hypothetical protein